MMTAQEVSQKYGKGRKQAPQNGSVGTNTKNSQWQDALTAAADFAIESTKGAVKGAGSTLLSFGTLGQQGLAKVTGIQPIGGQQQQDQWKQDVKNEYLTPTNTAQKIGYGAEQIAEFFIPGGAAAKAGKFLQGTSAISKLGKAGQVGAKLLPQVIGDVGVATAQSGGDLKTMGETAAFSLGGGALGSIASKGLKNFGNFLFRKTLPNTPKQLGNDLKRGIDIGEALSKTGVSFSKGRLLSKVADRINVLTDKVDDAVGAAGTNFSRSFDQVADDTLKLFNDKDIGKSLEATPINIQEIRDTVAGTVEKYRKLYAGKMLNPAEQHQLKQDIGVGLGRAWDKMLSTPIRAEAFAESKIYGALNDFLRKNIDGYEDLNRQLAPLREAQKRAGEKGPSSGYLTDLFAASLGGGDPRKLFEDPVDYFKGAATGLLLKRGVSTTVAKTLGGTIAKKAASIVDTPAFYQLFRKIITPQKNVEQPSRPVSQLRNY